MKNLTRRSALRQIAGVSLSAITAPLIPGLMGCRTVEPEVVLNVVLHGLFILNFTDVGIDMYTPFVEDHIYRAGNWDWNELQHLRPNKQYRLRGVRKNGKAPCVDNDCNIHFPQPGFSHTLRPEQSVFVVHFPFPDAIKLIRKLKDKPKTPPAPSPAPPPNTFVIQELSLCQVLRYYVPDYRQLDLVGTGWRPAVDPATNAVNLHFWAEPLVRVTRDHGCKAYEKLSAMLSPLTLLLGTDKTAPLDSDTGVYGLPREQEQGLSEWESGGEGSYPTNCTGIILNPGP